MGLEGKGGRDYTIGAGMGWKVKIVLVGTTKQGGRDYTRGKQSWGKEFIHGKENKKKQWVESK